VRFGRTEIAGKLLENRISQHPGGCKKAIKKFKKDVDKRR
jgi:hypothetical protein